MITKLIPSNNPLPNIISSPSSNWTHWEAGDVPLDLELWYQVSQSHLQNFDIVPQWLSHCDHTKCMCPPLIFQRAHKEHSGVGGRGVRRRGLLRLWVRGPQGGRHRQCQRSSLGEPGMSLSFVVRFMAMTSTFKPSIQQINWSPFLLAIAHMFELQSLYLPNYMSFL